MLKSLSKISLLIILSFGLGLFLYSPIIFQEGNPWPQIKGIARLTLDKNEIVKISDQENKYMTKSEGGREVIINFMLQKGYIFKEQLGSGFVFERQGKSIVVVHRQYSRIYSLWNFPEDLENIYLAETEIDLARELSDCLPKSDIGSRDKCQELLKTIVNFDDCVKAGFAIMKFNPPQCATIDDRTFVQESNGQWETALVFLENCEVEKVFQTHSKLVTLDLKNGNTLKVYEPKIDDIMKVLAQIRPKCGFVSVATE